MILRTRDAARLRGSGVPQVLKILRCSRSSALGSTGFFRSWDAVTGAIFG
jgi:hypothetical protein